MRAPDLRCQLWTLGHLGRLPDPSTTHGRWLLSTKILIRVKWEKGERGGCIDQRACVWAAVSQSEAGVGWDGKRPPLSLPPPQHLLHAPSLSLLSLLTLKFDCNPPLRSPLHPLVTLPFICLFLEGETIVRKPMQVCVASQPLNQEGRAS